MFGKSVPMAPMDSSKHFQKLRNHALMADGKKEEKQEYGVSFDKISGINF